jgi:hypothetical protein
VLSCGNQIVKNNRGRIQAFLPEKSVTEHLIMRQKDGKQKRLFLNASVTPPEKHAAGKCGYVKGLTLGESIRRPAAAGGS